MCRRLRCHPLGRRVASVWPRNPWPWRTVPPTPQNCFPPLAASCGRSRHSTRHKASGGRKPAPPPPHRRRSHEPAPRPRATPPRPRATPPAPRATPPAPRGTPRATTTRHAMKPRATSQALKPPATPQAKPRPPATPQAKPRHQHHQRHEPSPRALPRASFASIP